MPESLDHPDRDAFESWVADITAGRGFKRCLDRCFCFRCEQHTLVVRWIEDVLVLHCPCFERH